MIHNLKLLWNADAGTSVLGFIGHCLRSETEKAGECVTYKLFECDIYRSW